MHAVVIVAALVALAQIAAAEFDAASIKPTGLNRPVNTIEATMWNAMYEPISRVERPSAN